MRKPLDPVISTTTGRDNTQAKSRKRGPGDDPSTEKKPKLGETTDITLWRVKDDESRLTWHYLTEEEAKEWPQTSYDKYFLGLDLGLPDLPTPKNPLDAAKNGLSFYEHLQMPSGHWGCEYGGPMFLTPGFVITWYVTNTPVPEAHAIEMKNFILARAHPDDGGWGLHIEGESTVFGTSMNYTALRLLGLEADHPAMVKARGTLHKLGGAVRAPHWAKFWLSVLGVMDWDIVNPVPPEIWLLPDWVPIAPWKWWIHIRQVFLPMGFIASRKWSGEQTALVQELKEELFVQDHRKINWAAHRNDIAPGDNYHPKSWLLNTVNWLLVNVWYPYLRTDAIKIKAEAWAGELVDMEDANTGYACLAPVNAPMNTLVCYVRDGGDSYGFKRHIERLQEYLWVRHDGMFSNGTNGVQCWDTAFSVQAIFDAGLHNDPKYRSMLERALQYLESQQLRENCKDNDKCYRHPRKGGWPFSNKDQGYAVSDCTSEGLKGVILLQKVGGLPPILDDERIYEAVDCILTYQNDNGALSSYESRRAGTWMEMLNAAEVFGNIMVEYDYPECTTACVTALSLFHQHWPDYRTDEIKLFIERATNWIRSAQRLDGSWYGSWGICFTYATMFALESMASIGEVCRTSNVARRGCAFLAAKQRDDGGWSESYKACETMEYHEHPSGSQVVMTAWAVIGLMEAEYPGLEVIKRGIRFIMSRQQPNGEWKQEAIEGVFNKSCMISYPNYKFEFTIKALGMFARRYPNEKL